MFHNMFVMQWNDAFTYFPTTAHEKLITKCGGTKLSIKEPLERNHISFIYSASHNDYPAQKIKCCNRFLAGLRYTHVLGINMHCLRQTLTNLIKLMVFVLCGLSSSTIWILILFLMYKLFDELKWLYKLIIQKYYQISYVTYVVMVIIRRCIFYSFPTFTLFAKYLSLTLEPC